MNCTKVRQQLSPYFDSELTADVRAEVGEHLQTCADCAAALARIRSLSAFAHKLPDPVAPEIWPAIEQQLAQYSVQKSRAVPLVDNIFGRSFPRRVNFAIAALAASILVALAAWPLLHSHGGHDEMAANLSNYIDEFRSDPNHAEQTLLAKYVGRSIQPNDAIKLVNYKPMAPAKFSDGVARSQMYLIEMPCCKCVQSVYIRPDGKSLAIFEHVDAQPTWFGKRSTTHANCSQKDVCLIQCEGGQFAATWKQGDRFITLVGVKDQEEVNRLVADFDTAS